MEQKMFIIPAIDILDDKAVRLFKGDYSQKTVYANDPSEVAKKMVAQGFEYIHLVDLNGAKEGEPVNASAIKKIRESVSVPLELGGGIRDIETISFYLDEIGINRVILGTAAIKNPTLLKEAIVKFGPEKIVMGADMKDGRLAVSGWEEGEKDYFEFVKNLPKIGVKYIIATDISKDGTLGGPNFSLYEKIKEIAPSLDIIVSGGISSDDDITRVREKNYYGVIVGKAYYEGKISLCNS
jgi:phosphoribosylformimino-5-aminoimidazole carboxamide ribotide isomerase